MIKPLETNNSFKYQIYCSQCSHFPNCLEFLRLVFPSIEDPKPTHCIHELHLLSPLIYRYLPLFFSL